MFSTYRSSNKCTTITLVDGLSSTILGVGSVIVTPLSLSFVLYLPKFPFNLMLVSQITRDLHCCVSFFLDLVFFRT